ncbi:hypothetical protein GCM10018980_15880 [Streptomyces capoamus]|uniref:Uncharacterized protein n=1 Tax=Streptomyces capoamus TaxID=68183 RepID=A0A919C1R8_9ACTN|nr:hypothetical protein GCM10010501_18650 [Streptomyces libani subsp. rufus]GHG41056.1 hypothetical protein GCM10018980_15880 [Streptomyces capoamus]
MPIRLIGEFTGPGPASEITSSGHLPYRHRAFDHRVRLAQDDAKLFIPAAERGFRLTLGYAPRAAHDGLTRDTH